MRCSLLIIAVMCLIKMSAAQRLGLQDTTILNVEHIRSIKGTFTDHFIDPLSQIYAITPSGQMRKYGIGDSVALLYNDLKKYGKPSSLDASNPLRTIVFFKSYAWVAILDRLLTLRNSCALRKYNLFNITAVANAYDNALWLFDARNMQLLKMDENGRELLRSADLRNMGVGLPTNPSVLMELGQLVILFDRNSGLYCFDRYGAFQKRYPTKDAAFIGICKDGIVLCNNDLISVFNPSQPLLQTTFKLPESIRHVEQFKICNNLLSVLTQSGIEIYQIK